MVLNLMFRETQTNKKARKQIQMLSPLTVSALYECAPHRVGFGFKNEKVSFRQQTWPWIEAYKTDSHITV